MYNYTKITKDIYNIGGSDRRIALFENVYPVPGGVSYNSYFVDDTKTCLIDTVDKSVAGLFIENLMHLLNGRNLDYIIVTHMEPDHAATLSEVLGRFPDAQIVTGKSSVPMMQNFRIIGSVDGSENINAVAEGDTLSTGRHNFTFVSAPMVHWPEVTVAYDSTDKILFSADAFGTFGALNGNIFADGADLNEQLSEMRRYYTNIVGKYGTQVTALLRKAEGLDIAYVCPLHGPVWRKKINLIVEKYAAWATYTPEENGVVIVYASVYGNTKNAAEILAAKLADEDIKTVLYDVSVTHASYIIAELFKYSHAVFVSTTYNAGIFVNMENLLHDVAAHNLQNRTFAVVENGTWAATSGGLMREILDGLKNVTVLNETVSVKSAVKDSDVEGLVSLAAAVKATFPEPVHAVHDKKIEQSAMFDLSYGLYVLTAEGSNGSGGSGCIVNTVVQVTDSPKRVMVAVNKANHTHDIIAKTGVFNISCLTTDTPFSTFKQWGFQSGRDTDKTAGQNLKYAENGVAYIADTANAFISGKVTETVEYETHTVFFADVTEAAVLSNLPSVTYAYYQGNIKPKPSPVAEKQKGWVCRVCGYVHEGDELPEDIICPLCKHGADAFERL